MNIYDVYSILNVRTDFKRNVIYKHVLDNNT